MSNLRPILTNRRLHGSGLCRNPAHQEVCVRDWRKVKGMVGELSREATTEDFSVVRKEGARQGRRTPYLRRGKSAAESFTVF